MGTNTNIQWTDVSWNIARGCTKVDADCKFCYMYRDSFDGTRYAPDVVRKTKTVFNLPSKTKEPSKIFTSSLTDFYHPECDSFRDAAWDQIRANPQHVYQILTKRPERIAMFTPQDICEMPNVWIGTSVGHQDSVHRIATLVDCPIPNHKFISFEPLYGPIHLNWALLFGIDWIIVGGESGNENGKYKYRTCSIDWIMDIYDGATAEGIPVFIKQSGTHLQKQRIAHAKENELCMATINELVKDRHGVNYMGDDYKQFPQQMVDYLTVKP